MNGKIKLKLNQKSSIRNNIYEVFIDGNFIGIIDYKNPKLDFITNLGNHKILVKGKEFQKEQNFNLSSRKIVLPIEINENFFWTNQSPELPKIMNGFVVGFLLVYSVIITYLFTKINSSQSPYFVFPEADSFQAFQKIVSPHHFLLPLPTVTYLPALVF